MDVTVNLTSVFATGTSSTSVDNYDLEEYDSELYALSFSPGIIPSITTTKLIADVNSAGIVNTLTTSQAITDVLTSVNSTGSTGTLSKNISKALTGVNSTGTVDASSTSQISNIALTGVTSTGTVDASSTSQEVIVNLTGVNSTSIIDISDNNYDLEEYDSELYSFSFGIIPNVTSAEIITGVNSTGLTNILSASQEVIVNLAGVNSTGTVDASSTSQEVIVNLAGVNSTGTVDALSTSQAITDVLTSVNSVGSIGTLTTTQEVIVNLAGVNSTAIINISDNNYDLEEYDSESYSFSFGIIPSVVAAETITGVTSTTIVGTLSTSQISNIALTSNFITCTTDISANSYDLEEYDSELYSFGSSIVTNANVSFDITGISTVSALNGIITNINVVKALTGVNSIGTVDASSTSQEVIVNLTGVTSTGTVIDTAADSYDLEEYDSELYAYNSGIIAIVNINVNFTGISTIPVINNITTHSDVAKILTGVTSAGTVDASSTSQGVTVNLTGVTSVGTTNTLSTSQGVTVNLTSVFAHCTICTIDVVSEIISKALVSVNSTGLTGTLSKTVSIELAGITSTGTVDASSEIISKALTGVESTVSTNVEHISQNIIEMECVPFTVSWSVPGLISSYAFSVPLLGVDLYILGNKLYAAGQAGAVLERTIEYIDSNLNHKTVNDFAKLPNKYYAITKYIAPEVYEKQFDINVNYYDETLLKNKTIVYELIIRYNFAVSNIDLKNAVAEGVV